MRIGNKLYSYNKRRGYITKRTFTIIGETKTQWKLETETGAKYNCRKSDLRLLGEPRTKIFPNEIPEYDVMVEKQRLAYKIRDKFETIAKRFTSINNPNSLKKLRELDKVTEELLNNIKF